MSKTARRKMLDYAYMVLFLDAGEPETKPLEYKDPRTDEIITITIDKRSMESVEEKLGMITMEQREYFRKEIRNILLNHRDNHEKLLSCLIEKKLAEAVILVLIDQESKSQDS